MCFKEKNYCDNWCKEQDSPYLIKKSIIHTCKICGDLTSPFRHKDGRIANWRKLCDNCLENKKYGNKKEKDSLSEIK